MFVNERTRVRNSVIMTTRVQNSVLLTTRLPVIRWRSEAGSKVASVVLSVRVYDQRGDRMVNDVTPGERHYN